MSSNSFSTSPTRQIEAGDTPGFNDDQISRLQSDENIPKGTPCVQIAGVVTIAKANNVNQTVPVAPFVPVESKDNSTPVSGAEIRGVGPGQMVALTLATGPVEPGEYIQQGSGTATLIAWVGDNNQLKYARYFGKEAGVFSRDGTTPHKEDLSVGVIPDQTLASGEIGWFTLMEAHEG